VPGRFGDISASTLTGILWTLDRGYLEDWSDLVEYMVATDGDLQSLYTTTITRVTQATWKVKPNKYGDRADAQVAAEFCDELIGRMSGWRLSMTTLLHALALGFQPMEKEWSEDRVARKNLVRKLHFRHGHRFRLDTQYQYRLYDRGEATRTKHDRYGQVLDPNRWIVHKHQSVAGYPTVAGLMRAGAWTWMFKRWAEKGYVRVLEKNGAPYFYVECTPDTPQAVRDKMVEFLQDLHTEKAAVMEAGSELKVVPGSSITGTPLHDLFLDKMNATYGKLWLGASDITDPGANGSNAAVNTRAGVTADPRMVAYGIEFGETVSDQLFKQALEMNRHLFGGRMAPVPTYEADTASDEVQVDKQDLAEQGGGSINVSGALDDTLDTGTPDPLSAGDSASVDGGTSQPVAAGLDKAADTALNGAQVTSMVDIIKTVTANQMPRDSAKAIIKRAFNMDDAAADEILGTVGNGFVPAAPEPQPAEVPMTASDPKALTETASSSPPKRKRSTRKASSSDQMTLPISSRSLRLLAETLRGVSGDPEP